ncbi:pyridoxamine 5'-phosphate oxidase [Streptomyces sp. NA04227]|uniref:pyridoxamine 5'-phosphate oxidase n=1 Tax=Streptomyces sp. NA04227 TaxID=2742136 RepID=UPI0020CA66F8|nr:pyridoxamine 5'-phosphate oxidase [Streptomyces sp. NA04227]
MREQYRAEGIDAEALAADPMTQFGRWFREAAESAMLGGLYEPNAMVLSTADEQGRPSARTVLMKQYDASGFVFFTNYRSRKARELSANPHAALLFPWHAMARQVHVTGTVGRIAPEETAAYFHARPHGSQLGAWASAQSEVIASRDELDRAWAELNARYPVGSEVPVPPDWGGYRLAPSTVEFWQGRGNRLHDRLRYVRIGEGPAAGAAAWRVERLSP